MLEPTIPASSSSVSIIGWSPRIASQKLVGRLLKRLNFSLQANCKTREGAHHPDRNAQFGISMPQ
jgi:hypothetical protein